MSYTPHTWTTGETITAAKLNALENGVAAGGGGGFYEVTATTSGGVITLDASYNDLLSAVGGGSMPYVVSEDDGVEFGTLMLLTTSSGDYTAYFGWLSGNTMPFWATGPDDPLAFED